MVLPPHLPSTKPALTAAGTTHFNTSAGRLNAAEHAADGGRRLAGSEMPSSFQWSWLSLCGCAGLERNVSGFIGEPERIAV